MMSKPDSKRQVDHASQIKTIFCDIDGCALKHHGNIGKIATEQCELLPGVEETFADWAYKGYTIVLTTGRPESLRTLTERQLTVLGLYYHHLIMDLPRGQRVLINDFKPGRNQDAAVGVSVKRNEGLKDVDV